MFSKTQGRIIVEFRFVENVGSARHIQPLSDEDDVLSDSCAMAMAVIAWDSSPSLLTWNDNWGLQGGAPPVTSWVITQFTMPCTG